MAACIVYLIDPFSKTVSEAGYDGELHTIYTLLQCQTFDVVRVDPADDALFVDDEGLFKDGQAFFIMPGWPQPLAGRALWTGTDSEGNTVAPTATIEDVSSKIVYLTIDQVRAGAASGRFI